MDRTEALAIAIPVLEQFFQDNTLDQTLGLWGNFAVDFPQRVEPILTAFDVLANDASLDLRPVLLKHGWVNLFHTVDGEPVIYTPEEHREWLRLQVIPNLRQAAGK
jgi:hypothetical protein